MPEPKSCARRLSGESTRRKLRQWMIRNSIDPSYVSKIDIDAEFGKDLSFSEAVETAIHKFPTLWKSEAVQDYEARPKQIIFIKRLAERIAEGQIQVTYRKSPKIGTYYIIENRFKQKPESSRMLIEFYRTDKVDPYKLTDEEARLAGVESADEIRALFEKWYGLPIPTLYRNWFRMKETLSPVAS
jgi:hypothetical protein